MCIYVLNGIYIYIYVYMWDTNGESKVASWEIPKPNDFLKGGIMEHGGIKWGT